MNRLINSRHMRERVTVVGVCVCVCVLLKIRVGMTFVSCLSNGGFYALLK